MQYNVGARSGARPSPAGAFAHGTGMAAGTKDSVETAATAQGTVAADLVAVLVAVTESGPCVLTVQGRQALPSGPLETAHRSLQSGLRAWVERQTHHPVGYLEQLYTFADRGRTPDGEGHLISISYLGLTRPRELPGREAAWQRWYEFFPWEDHRAGRPALIDQKIVPRLTKWAAAGASAREDRMRRTAIAFGTGEAAWNEELALQRYELLFEAGLVPESAATPDACVAAGQPMMSDHRRILATGIARLRAKIKYRPVVFELMPPDFTLLQLQRCVEAIAGRAVHKQNFRRLIELQELVEETGAAAQGTGGRPAKVFRFRREVLAERAAAGTKPPLARS